MKKRYDEQLAVVTAGDDVAQGLQAALAGANEKHAAAMAAAAAELAKAKQDAEATLAAEKARLTGEIEDLKGSGAAGETTETQVAMQKRDKMIRRLGAELKKAKEKDKAFNKKLASARSMMQEKLLAMKKELGEKNKRILELTKGAAEQATGGGGSAASGGGGGGDPAAQAAAEAALAEAKETFEKQLSAKQEQLDVATGTLKKLKEAGGGGGGGSGDVALVELQTEVEALRAAKKKNEAQIDKLRKNGEMAMAKLKESMTGASASAKEMKKMKAQREKETLLVQRAMGEIKKYRGEITDKDKTIAANKAKTAKMMEAVGALKADHKKQVENTKAKVEQQVREARALVKAELDALINTQKADIERLGEELRAAEAKAASVSTMAASVEEMIGAVASLKAAEQAIRARVESLRQDISEDIPKVVNACTRAVPCRADSLRWAVPCLGVVPPRSAGRPACLLCLAGWLCSPVFTCVHLCSPVPSDSPAGSPRSPVGAWRARACPAGDLAQAPSRWTPSCRSTSRSARCGASSSTSCRSCAATSASTAGRGPSSSSRRTWGRRTSSCPGRKVRCSSRTRSPSRRSPSSSTASSSRARRRPRSTRRPTRSCRYVRTGG
jgi:chorismate mutase